jgi:hypothetical protein
MRMKRYLAAVSAVAVLGLTGLASTAPAQTTQNGLVNISATNTTVQVPISVAANLCNISLAIIAQQRTGPGVPCDALSTATTGPVTVGGPAGPTTQNGLVNVSLTNTTVQVPIAAAINLCGVNAAVLAVQNILGGAAGSCTATSSSGTG